MLKRLDNDLPPWRTGADERKRQQMEQWVNRKLDEVSRPARLVVLPYPKTAIRPTSDEWLLHYLELKAVGAAECGDIKPLRRIFPKHARFIALPKLKRGEHFSKDGKPHFRLQCALADVPRIRAIWKKHYGKTNRPQGELTAEEIAAKRWNLAPSEVRRRRISRTLGKVRPR